MPFFDTGDTQSDMPLATRLVAAGHVALPTVLLAGLLLAACTPAEKFAPSCPDLHLLRDGADATTFNGHGQDATDLVLNARLVAVPAQCQTGGAGKVSATMRVYMELNRGPALQGRAVNVPYFVSILDGGKLIQQQNYAIVGTFPPNVDRLTTSGEDIELLFPVPQGSSAARYTIYVSFRLTPEQLQYNRSRAAN